MRDGIWSCKTLRVWEFEPKGSFNYHEGHPFYYATWGSDLKWQNIAAAKLPLLQQPCCVWQSATRSISPKLDMFENLAAPCHLIKGWGNVVKMLWRWQPAYITGRGVNSNHIPHPRSHFLRRWESEEERSSPQGLGELTQFQLNMHRPTNRKCSPLQACCSPQKWKQIWKRTGPVSSLLPVVNICDWIYPESRDEHELPVGWLTLVHL